MLTVFWLIVAIIAGGIADVWYYIDTPNRHRRAREAYNERLRLNAEASRYRQRRNAFLKRLGWRLTLRRGPALKPMTLPPTRPGR